MMKRHLRAGRLSTLDQRRYIDRIHSYKGKVVSHEPLLLQSEKKKESSIGIFNSFSRSFNAVHTISQIS